MFETDIYIYIWISISYRWDNGLKHAYIDGIPSCLQMVFSGCKDSLSLIFL